MSTLPNIDDVDGVNHVDVDEPQQMDNFENWIYTNGEVIGASPPEAVTLSDPAGLISTVVGKSWYKVAGFGGAADDMNGVDSGALDRDGGLIRISGGAQAITIVPGASADQIDTKGYGEILLAVNGSGVRSFDWLDLRFLTAGAGTWELANIFPRWSRLDQVKSANFDVEQFFVTYLLNCGSAFDVDLPPVAGFIGAEVTFKRIDNNAHQLRVKPDGSETVEYISSWPLVGRGAQVTLRGLDYSQAGTHWGIAR